MSRWRRLSQRPVRRNERWSTLASMLLMDGTIARQPPEFRNDRLPADSLPQFNDRRFGAQKDAPFWWSGAKLTSLLFLSVSLSSMISPPDIA
jgi:hypothetical protein